MAWHMNIRPLTECEQVTLRGRWFRGATVLGYATRTESGLGVEDRGGSVQAEHVLAVLELPLAGFWHWQGRVLHVSRYKPDKYHWTHVERMRDGMFRLFDTHGLSTDPLTAERVASVARDFISVLHQRPRVLRMHVQRHS